MFGGSNAYYSVTKADGGFLLIDVTDGDKREFAAIAPACVDLTVAALLLRRQE